MLSLLPNEHWDYRLADALRGLGTALAPRRPAPQPEIHIAGLGSCLAARSGRVAIIMAVKALGLPPGASIGVPLYCCPVVFKAIDAAGCHARFIDVDPDTYCLSAADLAAKSSELDAVIAVHMFGNVCDMPALRKAAPGKPFIEDCAQALGSRLDGRVAGSFGEIAVFSFRSGKYLSVGEGAAIYCNQTNLASQLRKLGRQLPVPTRPDEVIHVVNTLLRSQLRRKPAWGLIGSRLWSAYSEKVSYTSQAPILMGQIYETDRDLIARRMAVLGSLIERQRGNADYYARNLTVDAEMLCWERPGAFFNRLQYPLLVPSSRQCEQLAASLAENQISTARPYKDIAAIAAAHHGYRGDCPQAERIAETVIVIPCNYAVKSTEIERVASCVNRAWSKIGSLRQGAGGAPPIQGSANSRQHQQDAEKEREPHYSL